MAHQTHSIPWSLFASHLTWKENISCLDGSSSLHPKYKLTQGREFTHFVKAFIRNIRAHAISERIKYPPSYEAPSSEELVLDDATVRMISPTIHRLLNETPKWKNTRHVTEPAYSRRMCDHREADKKKECRCSIRYEDRKASSFLHRYRQNPCYQFYEQNGDAFFNLEIFKSLILYGQMDTALRICAIPEMDLKTWWEMGQCYDTDADLGWDTLSRRALVSYICLNVIYCFPGLWDTASGRTTFHEYRSLACYQRMLDECATTVRSSDLASFPHQQFFGVKPSSESKHYAQARTSHIPAFTLIDQYLTYNGISDYCPNVGDVAHVRGLLCLKGLPMEIALDILALANYVPTRRLPVAHDPLHRENEEELIKYLTYCWLLLVRTEVVAEELGMKIEWDELILKTIERLWGCNNCAMCELKWDEDSSDGKWVFR